MPEYRSNSPYSSSSQSSALSVSVILSLIFIGDIKFASVRMSLPSDAAKALGSESGEEIVVVIDGEGGVRIEEVTEYFG